MTYRLVVFAHIAAAMLLVGGSVLAEPRIRAAVRRAQTTQELRALLALGRSLAMLNPFAALVLVVTGLYLVNIAQLWTLGWVQVSIVAWVMSAILAGAVVKPAMTRLAAETARATEARINEHVDALRWSALWTYAGDFLAATDTAILFIMTMKPGLTGSLTLVVASNAVVFLVRALRPGARRAAVVPSDSAAAIAAGGHGTRR